MRSPGQGSDRYSTHEASKPRRSRIKARTSDKGQLSWPYRVTISDRCRSHSESAIGILWLAMLRSWR